MPLTQIFGRSEEKRTRPTANALARRMEIDHHFPKSLPIQPDLYAFLFCFVHERRYLHLEALLHSRCNGSEVAVYLGWRATENQGNDGGASHVDVLETCNKMISVWSLDKRLLQISRTTQNVNF